MGQGTHFAPHQGSGRAGLLAGGADIHSPCGSPVVAGVLGHPALWRMAHADRYSCLFCPMRWRLCRRSQPGDGYAQRSRQPARSVVALPKHLAIAPSHLAVCWIVHTRCGTGRTSSRVARL